MLQSQSERYGPDHVFTGILIYLVERAPRDDPGDMNDTAHTPAADDGTAALALRSALRRRGIAAADGDPPGSVRAEHAGRRLTVRHADGRWWRPMPGRPHVLFPGAPSGGEEALARDLAAELLRRL